MKNIFFAGTLIILMNACNSEEEKKTEKTTAPEFCDCVNADYHKDGDKEACEIIERELKEKLKSATKEEKGDILLKIQECKVKGQYDND